MRARGAPAGLRGVPLIDTQALLRRTDTIPLPAEKRLPNIEVLTVADLLADAIKRIHVNQSVSELFV